MIKRQSEKILELEELYLRRCIVFLRKSKVETKCIFSVSLGSSTLFQPSMAIFYPLSDFFFQNKNNGPPSGHGLSSATKQ